MTINFEFLVVYGASALFVWLVLQLPMMGLFFVLAFLDCFMSVEMEFYRQSRVVV